KSSQRNDFPERKRRSGGSGLPGFWLAEGLGPGRVDSKTGKEYVFLTNNRHWDAQTVADIYKERWAIEVFFKQIKSHMKIKSFVGTSENAVLIQIWTAMIAMLLLKYLKERAQYDWHLSNLVTFIRLNLFVKIDMMDWLNNPFLKPIRIPQGEQLRIRYG